MEMKRVMDIIQGLADGINPYTGEVMERDSVFQHPDTARALYSALEVLHNELSKIDRKKALPENTGKQWTTEDDTLILQEYENGVPIKEIAKKVLRTSGGVETRLFSLGKTELTPQKTNYRRFLFI